MPNDISLSFTGERYLPEITGAIALEHLHRYTLAQGFVAHKAVLDIACGEGYGSYMLSRIASQVIGVDISEEAVRHANAHYQAENLEFRQASASAIPVETASVDVVVSFETIEHHDQHEAMLAEIKRVLVPGGILIISSPDRLNYSVLPNYSNPYHVKELFAEQLELLLATYFQRVAIFGQRVVYGSVVAPLGNRAAGFQSFSAASTDTVEVMGGLRMPIYEVAIASDSELPSLDSSLFEIPIDGQNAAEALVHELADKVEHIATLDQRIANLDQTLTERDTRIAILTQTLAERDARITSLSETEAQFQTLIHSKSWRLTKPLRWVGRVARGEFAAALDPVWRLLGDKTPLAAPSPAPCVPPLADASREPSPPDTAYLALSARRDQPIADDPGYLRDEAKLIVFYLPQFHEVKENSEWWGPGFTEWTNVAKGQPNFDGHYQPHIPRDLGFYDLSNVEVMYRQAELARRYGVHGFCFYYYWFSGRRILETPIDNFLASDIDLPFCVCWANENWTRTWDGDTKSVLLEQKYQDGDEERLIQSLQPLFEDRRYIRQDGNPMLLIYRIKQMPDPASAIAKWRAEAERLGFPGLHIVAVDFYDISDPREVGADALVEFPPHKFNFPQNVPEVMPIPTNPSFAGGILDYFKIIIQSAYRERPDYTLYRGIIPGWDNTARRQDTPTIIIHSRPDLYGAWLRYLRAYTRRVTKPGDDSFIFINAWNEWGEGCHLEPDLKFGLRFLEQTAHSAWYDGHVDSDVASARERLLAELRHLSTAQATPTQPANLTYYVPPNRLAMTISRLTRRLPWLHRVARRVYFAVVAGKRP